MARALPPAPPASSQAARRVMQGNRSTDTRPEVALRAALHRRGLRFRKHHPPLPGLHARADVVFTRARVAVFVDGCFWHRCPQHGTQPRTNAAWWQAKLDRNVERDRRVDRALAESGWRVVRVWEHEAPDEVARCVELLLRS